MSARRLVLLAERYPDLSRMTIWRIERESTFPSAIVIRNRRYYDADELTAWEEARRRLGKTMPKRSAEAEAT